MPQQKPRNFVLVPKETDANLKSKAKFIKVLQNGSILIVHDQKPQEAESQLSVWSPHKLIMEFEFSLSGSINCIACSSEYLFFGMAANRVLVFNPDKFEQVHYFYTKRPPISMTIVDKRILICGLKNHAFTAVDFRNDFQQVGMSWNLNGNDWIQVYAD